MGLLGTLAALARSWGCVCLTLSLSPIHSSSTHQAPPTPRMLGAVSRTLLVGAQEMRSHKVSWSQLVIDRALKPIHPLREGSSHMANSQARGLSATFSYQ